ncbi:MAG: hypothetical protein AABN95_23685 [Acidobacteriota bacterium]
MFEIFNLRDDSFPVTPAGQEETPWFGFKALKREFESVVQRSAAESLRLCILNRGIYGAGKTHAASYFSERLASKRSTGVYQNFIPILIEAPKQPQKAFLDFSNRLLNAITFRRLARLSENLRTRIGEDALFERLLTATGSEDIASSLSGLSDSNLLVSKTYLLGGGTVKDLRELRLAKKLLNDHDFALSIIGVLFLLIYGESDRHESLSRVVLWIDEMEDLVFFPTRYYLPFTQALREIIDNTPLHLTVMLNFTFAEPENLPAIENVLGQAIMERVNQHIIFKEPSADDLKTYLLDCFSHNRLDKRRVSPTYPFSSDAFELLIDAAALKTPRFLNKLCDQILRETYPEWARASTKPSEISRAALEKKLPSILGLLEESRG